jgi:hypothetical protein
VSACGCVAVQPRVLRCGGAARVLLRLAGERRALAMCCGHWERPIHAAQRERTLHLHPSRTRRVTQTTSPMARGALSIAHTRRTRAA